MRMYPREFPPSRMSRPERQAERRVYEAPAAAARRGFAFYEWRRGYERIELDFAVWLDGLGRFALQMKGGRYLLAGGEWSLRKREGLRPVRSCPLDEAKLAALDLHDGIAELAATFCNPYGIPVVAFPDMTPDPAIEGLARRKGVYAVWGSEGLLERLEQIVRSRSMREGRPMGRISAEMEAVTGGLIRLGGGEEEKANGEAVGPIALSLRAGGRTVVSPRADEARLHCASDAGPGGRLRLRSEH